MANHKKLILYIALFSTTLLSAQTAEIPFKVNPLFDLKQPETLGLTFAKGAETFTIFSPKENENKYNHGVVLFAFKGMLYAQWQSSSIDEDGADTQVFYSRSTDGKVWEKPMPLTTIEPQNIKTSGGWWSDGKTLVAYLGIWPKKENTPKGGFTQYITSTDGIHWGTPKPVTNSENNPVSGIIEQDVHSLPNGRIITAFHMQPGLIATPFYTDDTLGITGWKSGKMENLPSKDITISRELEPSWFYRKDGAIVMIFRDQNGTFKKLAAISHDNGVTWTIPTLIDTPDSRAKQSAGNLPNGMAYMVNNPSGNKNRFPLVITVSKDGFLFDKAYLLRSGGKDLQPMKTDGKFKRIGYSYPKSFVWKNYLYVGYATNKEDVEFTRIPLDSF
ncbi:sialidase family protein [Flavobacterium sp. WC2509]|uniref:sialidase family protein n=1 Tax=Flavobacterium sp. WC2509 TaxID=3461406 RepID=UPI0040445B97